MSSNNEESAAAAAPLRSTKARTAMRGRRINWGIWDSGYRESAGGLKAGYSRTGRPLARHHAI